MKEHRVQDDFGRETVFKGEELTDDTTDTEDGSKPQWMEVTVWRTEAGNFVVRRTTMYRVTHSSENCSRADGYDLVPSTEADTYMCQSCNKQGAPGYAQSPRISVEVYPTPQDLIASFQSNGRYTMLSRSILSELASLDEGVDRDWSVVHVA